MNFKEYSKWDYSHDDYKYLDKDEELHFFYDSPFKVSKLYFIEGNGYYAQYRGGENKGYWDVSLIYGYDEL